MPNTRVPVLALMGGLAAMLVAVAGPGQASAHVNNTTTRSNTQHNTAAYDQGSGHPTGRRAHHPVKIRREIDQTSPKLLTGHGAVSGKRRHHPLTIHKTVDSASPR